MSADGGGGGGGGGAGKVDPEISMQPVGESARDFIGDFFAVFFSGSPQEVLGCLYQLFNPAWQDEIKINDEEWVANWRPNEPGQPLGITLFNLNRVLLTAFLVHSRDWSQSYAQELRQLVYLLRTDFKRENYPDGHFLLDSEHRDQLLAMISLLLRVHSGESAWGLKQEVPKGMLAQIQFLRSSRARALTLGFRYPVEQFGLLDALLFVVHCREQTNACADIIGVWKREKPLAPLVFKFVLRAFTGFIPASKYFELVAESSTKKAHDDLCRIVDSSELVAIFQGPKDFRNFIWCWSSSENDDHFRAHLVDLVVRKMGDKISGFISTVSELNVILTVLSVEHRRYILNAIESRLASLPALNQGLSELLSRCFELRVRESDPAKLLQQAVVEVPGTLFANGAVGGGTDEPGLADRYTPGGGGAAAGNE